MGTTQHARPSYSGLFKSGFGRFIDELELVFTHFDQIVVLQNLLACSLTVDVGAIGAVEVFQVHFVPDHQHHSVLAADR